MKYLSSKFYLCALFSILFLQLASQASEKWMTDFEAAKVQAKEEGKLILLDFTGSDWCPPCMHVAKTIFGEDAFYEAVESSFVFVELDFPRKKQLPEDLKKQNGQLAEKYGIQYFPTLMVITPEGEMLDKVVGVPSGGLDGFVKWLKAIHSESI